MVNFVNEWLIGRYFILIDDIYFCFNDFFFGRVILRVLSGFFKELFNIK